MVNPTWEERDLPVLKAIVELYEESGGRKDRAGDIQKRTGFDEETVQKALRALKPANPPYVTSMKEMSGGFIVFVGAPTPEARRAVGLWPTADGLADNLIMAMSQAADQEPDEEKRGRLKTAASWFGNAGRNVLVDVTAAVINRQISGGA
ncbi:hypothetical protein AB0M35_27550 [Micromonospora sp. NPDC051196]|uniref:hypothetical protein n=1 Tax=Micromonospora sp. NPDC051196 TaxID=3155281 RepID=UPI00344AA4AF